MKKLLQNKSMLHRFIAMAMSVVMILTLVAIDSKVHLFAEEEQAAKTIDITDVLKNDDTDKMVGFDKLVKFKFTSKTIEGIEPDKIMYKTYTGDNPDEKLPTSTDVTKYNNLGTDEELTNDHKALKYGFYYPVLNDKSEIDHYQLINTFKVVCDEKKPDITSVESSSDRLIKRDGYYVLNIAKKGDAAAKFEIIANDGENEADSAETATGIDKVVYLKDDAAEETEIVKDQDGKYIFTAPENSGTYTFKAYDKAGNVSDAKTIKIKKLKSAPSILNIKVSSKNNEVFTNEFNKVHYILSPETVKVTAEIDMGVADDGTSIEFPAKLYYEFLDYDKTNDKKTNRSITSVNVTKNADGKYTASFEIPANSLKSKRYTVAIWVTDDEFGNRSVCTDLNNKVLFISDQKPGITLRGVESGWVKSMEIEMTASDAGAYLDNMYYKYAEDGEQTVLTDGKNVLGFEHKETIEINGEGKSDSHNIVLTDGNYKLIFGAKNYIGLETTKEIEVNIDNTLPSLGCDSNAAKVAFVDGKDKVEYFSIPDTKTRINLNWSDATSGVNENKTKAVLKNSDNSYTLDVLKDSEGNGHVCINDEVASGKYKLEVSVYDNAGNKASTSVHVFVNRSRLNAKITAAADGAADGENIAAGTHTNASKVVVTGTAIGYELTESDVDFVLNGNSVKKNCSFTEPVPTKDGRNQIQVSYVVAKDEKTALKNDFELVVRNHGTDNKKSADFSFVYDTKAPSITVKGPAEYNKDAVTVKWEASDNDQIAGFEVIGTRTVYSYDSEGKLKSSSLVVNRGSKTGNATARKCTFNDEGLYDIQVVAYDVAGNEQASSNIKFVIDRGQPVAEYTEAVQTPISKDKVTEDRQEQRIDITVKDLYRIDAEDVTAIVTYETYDGEKGTKTVKFSNENKRVLKAEVKLKQVGGKAARYDVKITGYDKAKNSVVDKDSLAKRDYYIDKTKPNITITPDPKLENDGYYNKPVSFDIVTAEQFARLHTLVITGTITNSDGKITYLDGTHKDETHEFEYETDTYGVTYGEQGRYDLTIAVTDAAGNASSIRTKFAIDTSKPEVELDQVQLLNTGNVTLPVTLTDNMEGKEYTVHVVRVDANGNKVYDADFEKGTWSGTEIKKSYSFADEGDYTVTVSAVDKAGNKSDVKTSKFRIDRTAPVITISGVDDKQATTATATISVDEAFSFDYEGRSLGASDINVSIKKQTDGTGASNIAELTTGSFSSGKPHTASYTFDADGEYTITVNAKDLAGNVAASATKTFKIDTKAPVIKMTVADKNSKTIKSYDAVGSTDTQDPNYVDMSLSVEETFFKTNNVKITVKKDGKDISASSFTNYGNSSEVSTGSQRFDEDGVYDITVTAQDELGNKADDYNIVFTVDNTAPTVESTAKLLEFMAKSTASDDGNILLNADDFADIINSGYEALWNVNDTSVFDVSAKLDGVDLIDFSDMSDGYHKITLDASDEVGHKTSQEFEFTYDGTAPRIIISGVEDGDTVREPFDMTISLENEEDEITSIVINGNTIDPAQYKDTNQYKMHVEEYDTYTIEVTAKDKAGNISSTVDEKTGAVFTFKLSEKMSSVALILIIIAAILLVALLVFVIIAGRKRKKKNAA